MKLRSLLLQTMLLSALSFLSTSKAAAYGPCYANSCLVEGVDASIDFLGGYRNDKITTLIHAYDPPGTFILSDELKAKGINIYEVGLGGRIIVCREWVVRASGTFGRVHNGRYTENSRVPAGGQSFSRSKIRKGNTADFSAGAGYLAPCGCGFSVGPMVGWSYDKQRIKLGNATTNGLCDTVLDGLSYKTRWQGPWVGLEAQYSCYNVWLSAGYEYHWAHWHASWTLSGPDIAGVAFSDKRKSHNAFGNLVFLDSTYYINDCWEVGVGLKFQYWKASGGKEVPRAGSFAAVGLSPTEFDKVDNATWRSYEVLLMLGYHF